MVDTKAILANDTASAAATIQQSLATLEHAAFVEELKRRATGAT